jgi:HD-like signal output (HDOD) protein
VIGEELGHRDPDALFTAGLLHDMGKIAQCKLIPDRVVAIQDAIHRDGVPWAMAEEHLGIPRHDQIGRELARRWRLPPALAVPIEAHHNVLKPQLRDKVPVAQRTGAEAIAVADVIARDLVAGGRAPASPRSRPIRGSPSCSRPSASRRLAGPICTAGPPPSSSARSPSWRSSKAAAR